MSQLAERFPDKVNFCPQHQMALLHHNYCDTCPVAPGNRFDGSDTPLPRACEESENG